MGMTMAVADTAADNRRRRIPTRGAPTTTSFLIFSPALGLDDANLALRGPA